MAHGPVIDASERPVSVAMVGCGAVAELFHLPALFRSADCRIEFLVDKDLARARYLAKTFGAKRVTADYRDVVGSVDAAIVALPHHLHADICSYLLRNGVHLLVEKPMAMSSAQCREMTESAKTRAAVLALGLIRRFLPNMRWLRQAIDSAAFGRLLSFDIREGAVYNWPVHSDFFLKRETAGGGVLMDTGAHTIDQMLYWFGDVRDLEYYDDSYGGVEADCRLELTLQSGPTGVLELSRTRQMRNTACLTFERAQVETGLGDDLVRVSLDGGKTWVCGNTVAKRSGAFPLASAAAITQKDLFAAQVADFVAAVRGLHPPQVDGLEGGRSIAFIERCYALRRQLELPWLSFKPVAQTG